MQRGTCRSKAKLLISKHFGLDERVNPKWCQQHAKEQSKLTECWQLPRFTSRESQVDGQSRSNDKCRRPAVFAFRRGSCHVFHHAELRQTDLGDRSKHFELGMSCVAEKWEARDLNSNAKADAAWIGVSFGARVRRIRSRTGDDWEKALLKSPLTPRTNIDVLQRAPSRSICFPKARKRKTVNTLADPASRA
jgi:hypothetical protein